MGEDIIDNLIDSGDLITPDTEDEEDQEQEQPEDEEQWIVRLVTKTGPRQV